MRFDRVIVIGRETPGGVFCAVAFAGGQTEFTARDLTEALTHVTGQIGPGRTLIGVEAEDLPETLLAGLGDIAVWPGATGPVTLARVSANPLDPDVAACCADVPGMNAHQVRVSLLSEAFLNMNDNDLHSILEASDDPRAVLGAARPMTLRAALKPRAVSPRLKDDCFAMPQGVDWVPVDDALARLRAALHPVRAPRPVSIADAAGMILATDAIARRSNPPRPNSAVDGYGFAHAATGKGPQRLPLVDGRAAAGQPFDGVVPAGAAIRILTGAILPEGVDTVVLEEDTALDGAAVVFDGPVRPFANTRKAGEDVAMGDTALAAGHRLRAPDLALLAALGVAGVDVFDRLRVGVLSTGDEIVASPADPAQPHQIWDANRPMLLELARNWGYAPVDLGHVRDDPAEIESRLSDAAGRVDVILTSGGASAGDEDHVSALLRRKGNLSSWRIALKPGRPLALALWDGVPVFGLPGNPVAALVCALIFARPAFSLLAGGGWLDRPGFDVPAGFSKSKKPGRREFLRARLTPDGAAEVFRSEGSGRISGLSWAEGLVELPDGAAEIKPGDKVRFLPYPMLGLT